MRPRFAAAISLLAATSVVALPSVAGAHPHHNRGITIAATPNPITAGEGVLIYGAMRGFNNGNQTVQLYQHVAGTPGFTLAGSTQTNPQGFYEFPNSAGSVTTNTAWFVRGAGFIHSRTVYERVQAAVTLSESASSATTGQAVTFTGTVSPNHAGEQVLLQRENDNGGWGTVAAGTLDGTSSFTIPKAFARPNVYTLRAVFRADGRNDRGISDAMTLDVQQTQVPGFSINSSAPIISEGGTVTISGVLDQPGSSVVEPNTQVTLYGRTHGGPDQALADTTTAADGSYSFLNLAPTSNIAYRVATTLKPRRSTAVLYEGVADTISLTANPTTVPVGEPVTFSGNVAPNKAGQLVYLQRMGPDGHWVIVGWHYVNGDGSYQFARVFGHEGTAQFRTRVFGDGYNIGAASAPVTITVSGLPPVTSLPPASAQD
jgi:hypothetical protein